MTNLRKQGERYHRGSLKEDILSTVRALIAQNGRHWSMRDVARHLGVSSGAPYRHFATAAECEQELANRLYDEMNESMDAEGWACANRALFALVVEYVGVPEL